MGCLIGERVSIGTYTEIGTYSVIGESTRIGMGVFMPNRSHVGRYVFIGPKVTFTDDKYPDVTKANYRPRPPIIKDHASIGAGAVILPGVVIGEGAKVGAGSVVTKDVDPYTTVLGNPARPIVRPLKVDYPSFEDAADIR